MVAMIRLTMFGISYQRSCVTEANLQVELVAIQFIEYLSHLLKLSMLQNLKD